MTDNNENNTNNNSVQPIPVIGTVYLIGAGPGDPGLITTRGLERLRQADVVIFDALANPALLSEVKENAILIDAGKRAKAHKLKQEETNVLLAEHAKDGKNVARLKGGDPYVFGRGSEEAVYLHHQGVPVEVIPGITAAMGGIAYAGIPITHRHVACTATFITGHEDPTKEDGQVEYAPLADLAKRGGTLCFYMGMGRLSKIVSELTAHGLSEQTPAAVVQWGSLPIQRRARATLATIENEVNTAGLGAPSIIIIGDVCGLTDPGLDWFMRRPLFGKTIVITRTRQQSSDLRQQLENLGAQVMEAPTIRITPAPNPQAVQDAVACLPEYDWLVLTSTNGVTALREELDRQSLDARHFAQIKTAVIGDATAQALREQIGINADILPKSFVAEALARAIIDKTTVAGKRFLLLRAEIARPALKKKLEQSGAIVDEVAIYDTASETDLPENVLTALRDKSVDYITFTSSSTVTNTLELLGKEHELLKHTRRVSIGPITSSTLDKAALPAQIEASVYNIRGLVDAIINDQNPS